MVGSIFSHFPPCNPTRRRHSGVPREKQKSDLAPGPFDAGKQALKRLATQPCGQLGSPPCQAELLGLFREVIAGVQSPQIHTLAVVWSRSVGLEAEVGRAHQLVPLNLVRKHIAAGLWEGGDEEPGAHEPCFCKLCMPVCRMALGNTLHAQGKWEARPEPRRTARGWDPMGRGCELCRLAPLEDGCHSTACQARHQICSAASCVPGNTGISVGGWSSPPTPTIHAARAHADALHNTLLARDFVKQWRQTFSRPWVG